MNRKFGSAGEFERKEKKDPKPNKQKENKQLTENSYACDHYGFIPRNEKEKWRKKKKEMKRKDIREWYLLQWFAAGDRVSLLKTKTNQVI